MNFDLGKAKNMVIFTVNRGGLILSKYSPEILTGIGLVGFVGMGVAIRNAAFEERHIRKEHMITMDRIHAAHEGSEAVEGYTEEDYKEDMTMAYAKRVAGYIKAYGPAIILGLASTGCVVGGHHILRKRNFAILAAFNAVNEAYKNYRARVQEKYGNEADTDMRFGDLEERAKSDQEQREEPAKEVKKKKHDGSGSPYAVYFDRASLQWKHDPIMNAFFLTQVQNTANDLLNIRGHVFLNEVYDLLGVPRTKDGQAVGWTTNGQGDDCVEIEVIKCWIKTLDGKWTQDLSMYKLDFNPDGDIRDAL